MCCDQKSKKKNRSETNQNWVRRNDFRFSFLPRRLSANTENVGSSTRTKQRQIFLKVFLLVSRQSFLVFFIVFFHCSSDAFMWFSQTRCPPTCSTWATFLTWWMICWLCDSATKWEETVFGYGSNGDGLKPWIGTLDLLMLKFKMALKQFFALKKTFFISFICALTEFTVGGLW